VSYLIRVVDLYVRYRWRQEPILKGVNAEFYNKHLLLGPNGSGKTTLFRAIAGLTPILKGKVLIDGKDVNEIYGTKGLLALNLSEVLYLLRMSAYDNLRVFMDLTDGDIDLAIEILNDLGIETQILRKRKPWELSAGQRKAYSTALALASKARNVLLDEPFEQLDPARKSRLIKYLTRYDGTIVLNTHETWILAALKEWTAYLMFEGVIYGPIHASKLMNANIISGEVGNALVSFRVSGKTYSIVERGVGEPISKLITLDRIYELSI